MGSCVDVVKEGKGDDDSVVFLRVQFSWSSGLLVLSLNQTSQFNPVPVTGQICDPTVYHP